MVKDYSIVYRLARWWILLDGQRWGPFDSSSIAEARAISLAKDDVRTGEEVRVHAEHPSYRLVYDSSSIDAVRPPTSKP